MKKLSILLSLIFIFSLTPTAFAHNEAVLIDHTCLAKETLVFSSEEEKLDYLKSGKLSADTNYTFIVKSSITPRYSICGNCGDSGLNRYTEEREYAMYTTLCPETLNALNLDYVHKKAIYQIEDCYICEYHAETNLGRYNWYAQCNEPAGVYEQIIPGATMSQGYSAHQCIDISQFG